MKISLLFPPSWHPSQPYLSLPSLTGFLNQAGMNNVIQRDLNIEALDTMLNVKYGQDIYVRLLDKIKQLENGQSGEIGPNSKEHYTRIVESLDRFPYLIDRIELAKETLRSEEFYDMERYRDSCFSSINGWN